MMRFAVSFGAAVAFEALAPAPSLASWAAEFPEAASPAPASETAALSALPPASVSSAPLHPVSASAPASRSPGRTWAGRADRRVLMWVPPEGRGDLTAPSTSGWAQTLAGIGSEEVTVGTRGGHRGAAGV